MARSEPAVIVLVIGGTRSGKSKVAERIAAQRGAPVTVVVPAIVADSEHADRIAEHRARRPASWTTVECGAELVTAVAAVAGTLLVDSLGTWVAVSPVAVDVAAFTRALLERRGDSVVVTEEVGLAVHAPTDAGRRFADAVGSLNVAVADIADEALLVIAGRILRLEDGPDGWDRPDA
jgi:adenosyl cobinamide kinase/adenosyl cobinamide phosphate guanylyltransferase